MKAEVMGPLSAQTEVQAKQMPDGRIKVEFLHAPYSGSSIVVEGLPAPSSVSNPVAFAEWIFDNKWYMRPLSKTWANDDLNKSCTIEALYALFTSQHGEQETNQENLWEGVIHCILTNNWEGAKELCMQHYHITPKNKQ